MRAATVTAAARRCSYTETRVARARSEVLKYTTEVAIDDLAGMRLRLLSNSIPARFAEAWWALLWPGGHVLARHVLSHPQRFRGRRVVDLGSGGGVGAVAAALAGATRVVANDVCHRAAAAATLNAELNGVSVSTLTADIIGTDPADHFEPGDALVVGDLLYEAAVADPLLPWLQQLAGSGVDVTVGDPGRWVLNTLPAERRAATLCELEVVELPTIMPSEVSWAHYSFVRCSVWRVLPGGGPVDLRSELCAT